MAEAKMPGSDQGLTKRSSSRLILQQQKNKLRAKMNNDAEWVDGKEHTDIATQPQMNQEKKKMNWGKRCYMIS
jgi:hypothetical protein